MRQLADWTGKQSVEDQTTGDRVGGVTVEVTKALAALKPLYGKDNIEILTDDGQRVLGIVKSMKTTQALTMPSVKIQQEDGRIVKIPFASILQIIDHNSEN